MDKIITHVTGCDGSGKSTLCETLVRDLNGIYTHFSNPKDKADGKQQYFDFLEQNKSDNKMYICDRFHDGEWIYAPIYRGYTGDYLNDFERAVINDHNYLLIFVTASLETILNRTKIRGEDFVKEEHFQLVLDNFKYNYLMNQRMPFTIIDTTNTSPEDCVTIAKEDIKKLYDIWSKLRPCINRDSCSKTTNPMALPIGNIRAKYMVIGQNPGGKGQGSEQYIQTWSNGKSNDFFINILKDAGILLDCWFTNVVLCSTSDNKINDEIVQMCDHLINEIDIIKPQKIFTLGNQASKYVKKIVKDIEIIEVPHPTYVKRFYSGHPDKIQGYKDLFKLNSI